MSCILKKRTKQLSQLIIENPQTSVKNSIDFLRKMTVVAVSYITAGRKIFPDSAYERRKFYGTKIKVLKGREDVRGARQLVDTLKNALQCIQSQHLSKIFLVIRDLDSNTTVEVYTMFFTYNEDEIQCHIQMTADEQQMEGENCNKEMPVDMVNQVKQLLLNLESHIKELPALPRGLGVALRLQIKDDEDFVMPDLFKSMDSLDFNLPPEARTRKFGRAESKFNAFAVSSKSGLAKESHEDDDQPEHSETDPNTLYCNSSVLITNAADSKENSETVKLSDTMSSVHLRDKEVKCICERNDDILENIRCAACFTYQHKACYKLLDHETVDRHVCVNCHNPDNPKRICTNLQLLNEEGTDEAFYRRALSLCENNKKVSVNTFVSHLNLSRKEALKIFQRLIEDGCFVHEPKERNIRTVDHQHLKDNILNFYFNTKSTNNIESMETEEYIQASDDEQATERNRKRNCDSDRETNPKRFKYAEPVYTPRSVEL